MSGDKDQKVLDAIDEMNELHVELGRKAAELALSVLENVDPDEISVAAAVSLLRFGVELERKALLGGSEDGDGDDSDPFEDLAKQLGQTQPSAPTPEEG